MTQPSKPDSKRRIEGLPERPLTFEETDRLVDSEKFVPLTLMKSGEGFRVYSLLHATDAKGWTVAYSDEHGYWVRVVEMDSDEYDPDVVEQRTHDFVGEHCDFDVDAGMVPVDEVENER